jgi:large subunit ribosomal protein L15
MLSLSNLKPSKNNTKKRKRVGRGNASGHGTYSTRGLKGQKSRSGVSNLKRLGLKKMLLSTPKIRGFKSMYPKNQVISFLDLNDYFKDGEKVDLASLLKKGIIKNNIPVKLLSNGELKIKNLEISGLKISKKAQEELTKMGGKVK